MFHILNSKDPIVELCETPTKFQNTHHTHHQVLFFVFFSNVVSFVKNCSRVHNKQVLQLEGHMTIT